MSLRGFTALAFSLFVLPGCTQAIPAHGWWPFSPNAPTVVANPIHNRLEAIAAADLALVVDKSLLTLEVYRYGKLVNSYPITIGSRPKGPKRYEGDMRTPEGLYHIIDKRPHRRWRYFLGIDYPNDEDRQRYQQDLALNLIPTIGGTVQGIGRAIGIHGNDRSHDQAKRHNWTHGCVAMANEDITELFKSVDIGTPVLLLP